MAINTLGRTTLSAAATQDGFVTVASATGITAGDVAAGTPPSQLYIVDPGQRAGEVARVVSVSSTTIGVRRTHFVVPHASGSTVWFGPPDVFYSYSPRGAVTAALAHVNQWINVETGEIFVPNAGTGGWVPITGLNAWNTATAVTAQAATATLVASDFGKTHTNTGSSGTIVLTLPAAAAVAGNFIRVQLTVAQIVRLQPVTGESIYFGGSGVVTKYLNIAGVIGNYVVVYSDGAAFHVIDADGVITKEA